MNRSIRRASILLFFISFFACGFPYIGCTQEQNCEKIVNDYTKTRLEIFNGTYDEKINGPDLFYKNAGGIAQSDEEKALATILYAKLAYVAQTEATTNTKPLGNESHEQFLARNESFRVKILNEAMSRLERTFSKINIPKNSYLIVLYHSTFIELANEVASAQQGRGKLPPNVFAHCDALMNSGLFNEESDITEPICKLSIWKPTEITHKTWLNSFIHGIRLYLFNYRFSEESINKRNQGMFLGDDDIKEVISLQNQLLLAKYPLSDYPFLADFLESQ